MDITSANSTAILVVEDLFPAGIKLDHFTADTAISSDGLQIAEARMGVDGHLAAGYTPQPVRVTVNLEADADCATMLQTVYSAMVATKKVFKCSLVVTCPSVQKVYTFSTGVLDNCTAFTSIGRVLNPTSWSFVFEKFYAAGI